MKIIPCTLNFALICTPLFFFPVMGFKICRVKINKKYDDHQCLHILDLLVPRCFYKDKYMKIAVRCSPKIRNHYLVFKRFSL